MYRSAVQALLLNFIQQLATIIPTNTNLKKAFAEGSEEDCLFVARLALFLGTYLKSFLPLFDQPDGRIDREDFVVGALIYLIRISEVNDEEIFKTCLEFWSHFAKELYTADVAMKTTATSSSSSSLLPAFHPSGLPFATPIGGGNNSNNKGKLMIFDTILHNLRIIMIDKMAKPEEVIIVEDDNGEIVRETTKDTEVIAQYKTMKESLVYLTHLNYEDTESIMLEKLDLQVAGGMFTWNGLNTLCWAIGSISGAMGELDEKRFLVSVIKDLLRLCEEVKGKDNKAVVASNIMYIVGQYPRFLRAHWKFLKTVVNKLFEFMHEYHPGVQDMACDTFLKISQKCKRKFMTPQVEDPQPFVLTLIADLHRHTADLLPHQVRSFYESVGTMLSDQGPAIQLQREEVLYRLMELQNNLWKQKMNDGAQTSGASLLELDSVQELIKILKINCKVCSSAGSIYLHQLSVIFRDALNLYRLYGEQVISACTTQGVVAVRFTLYKAMRGVKTEILELFIACLEVCGGGPAGVGMGNNNSGGNEVGSGQLSMNSITGTLPNPNNNGNNINNNNSNNSMNNNNNNSNNGGPEIFMTTFMPGILTEVLTDYRISPPAARDAKVLSLFATAVAVCKELLSPEIPTIMEAIFEKTLEMITTNMQDYPEHRINFFTFLREANKNCFFGLFSCPAHHQKLIIDSIVWAFKHTERNISETGLEILLELLQNISTNPAIAQSFYVTFMLSLIQDVFVVLTDRLHKSGFKLQASLLKHLFHITQLGQVTAPLGAPGVDNATFLKDHVATLLQTAFPNLSKNQIIAFVSGCFDVSKDLTAFKEHLRDFLIAVKEFANEDNTELFAEENEAALESQRREQYNYMASVPGLLKQSDIDVDPDL
jgi:exportin-1